jgi:hypothetical protein
VSPATSDLPIRKITSRAYVTVSGRRRRTMAPYGGATHGNFARKLPLLAHAQQLCGPLRGAAAGSGVITAICPQQQESTAGWPCDDGWLGVIAGWFYYAQAPGILLVLRCNCSFSGPAHGGSRGCCYYSDSRVLRARPGLIIASRSRCRS